MKKGILPFNFREIKRLKSSKKINITLFPLKYSKGLYNPLEDWEVYYWNIPRIIFSNIVFLFKNPKKYGYLFLEAFKTSTINNLLFAVLFSSIMVKKSIDHIHCHFGDNKLFVGYYCKKILNKPLTVTVHAHELYTPTNPQFLKKALLVCQKVISISNYNKKILIENLGIPKDKVEVIYLYPNVDENVTECRVLTVGRFVEKKGYDVLIEAIKNLNDLRFEFWFVVSHGDEKLIKQYINENSLPKNVTVFESVNHKVLTQLYRSCDIFCLPSRTVYDSNGNEVDKEGIPVSLMEGMYYGKPVISTRHVGIPELVEELLIDENNSLDLEKALRYMIENKKSWNSMGKRNKEIITNKFSIINADKLRRLFLEE